MKKNLFLFFLNYSIEIKKNIKIIVRNDDGVATVKVEKFLNLKIDIFFRSN